jgi:hypothetical protein
MADRPSWDYWLYEDLGNGRYRGIHDSGCHLDDSDIRSDGYEIDVDKWCRCHFWNAQEAALVSYFRDPDKVERTSDDFVLHGKVRGAYGDDDDDAEKNLELRNHITDLYELIRQAQKQEVLPEFFRPAMYIDWAKRMGVSVPKPIADELDRVSLEDDRATSQYNSVGRRQPTLDEAEEKLTSQQSRAARNLVKILLAVLLKTNLIKWDPVKLSGSLEKILDDLSVAQEDPNISVSIDTIKARLREAYALLKEIPS